jgi:hypothetical protein
MCVCHFLSGSGHVCGTLLLLGIVVVGALFTGALLLGIVVVGIAVPAVLDAILVGRLLDAALGAAAAAERYHEVEGGLLLDFVVLDGAAVLEVLAGEDEALLVGRDALLVLDLLPHGLRRMK